MSTIINALKKAQSEEAIKKEKHADRIIWVPTEKQSRWVLPLGVGFGLTALFLLFFWLFQTDTTQLTAQLDFIQKKETTSLQAEKSKDLSFKKKLTLSGIVWDDKEPIALINSLTLKQGDMIEGSRIISIQPEKVELSSNGETEILSLGSNQ